jgi:hypothetical protein
VRTYKGKEFFFFFFQEKIKHDDIEFQVCRNADVKCSIAERAQRTVRDRLYRYFTYTIAYRYLDVLPKFVKAHNDTVHSTTGMAPSKVTDSNVLAIWKKMNIRCVRTIRAKLKWDSTFVLGRKK